MLKSEKRDSNAVDQAKDASAGAQTAEPAASSSAAQGAASAAAPAADQPTGGETAAAGAADREPRPLPAGVAADTILAIFRNPEQHQAAMSIDAPLPAGLGTFLEQLSERIRVPMAAGESESASGAGEAAQVPDEREKELVKATLFFINRVLLLPGADHFRVLALTPDARPDDIQRNYRNLRRLLDQIAGKDQAHPIVMRISEAYVVLRDPERRRLYSEGLQRRRISGQAARDLGFAAEPRRPGPQAARQSKQRRAARLLLLLSGVGAAVWLAVHFDGSSLFKSPERSAPDVVTPPLADSAPTAPSQSAAVAITEPAPEVTPTPEPETAVSEGPAVESPAPAAAEPAAEQPTPPTAQTPISSGPVAGVAVTPVRPEAAVVPEPAATPAPAAGPSSQAVIQLLARAQRQIADGQLTMPAHNNARETYQEALRLDPTNSEALAGMGAIADRYATLARFRLGRDELAEASDMVTRGLEVKPDAEPLLALRDRIEQRRVELAQAEAARQQQRAAEAIPSGVAAATEPPVPSAAAVPEVPAIPELAEPASPAAAAVVSEVVAPASVVTPPSPDAAGPTPAAAESARPTLLDVEGRITDVALQAFIQRFVETYEKGDLTSFMALFSAEARTNNRGNRDEIREDYRSLFESSDSRVMRVKDLRWNRQSEQAFGEGDFSLSIVSRGESRPRAYEGRITFQIVRRDADLLLTGLFHSQRKLAEQ